MDECSSSWRWCTQPGALVLGRCWLMFSNSNNHFTHRFAFIHEKSARSRRRCAIRMGIASYYSGGLWSIYIPARARIIGTSAENARGLLGTFSITESEGSLRSALSSSHHQTLRLNNLFIQWPVIFGKARTSKSISSNSIAVRLCLITVELTTLLFFSTATSGYWTSKTWLGNVSTICRY